MTYRYRSRQEAHRIDQHMGSILERGDVEMARESFEGVPRAAEKIPDITKYGTYAKLAEITGADVQIDTITDWMGKGDPSMGDNPALAVGITLLTGDKVWCIIAQEVLYRKLSTLRDDLPVVAEFYKPKGKRYYDLR